jgi:pimeloyl-ACP methyl ester carboxylesterase
MPTTIVTDGTRLHYVDWGSGPSIVFTHGWAASGAMWEYQMLDLVAAGFRCVALDRRGCGRSEDPGHGYDADTFADDLAALLEQLDLSGVTLVAHSMGAPEAARCLCRHGDDRLSRLVLVAGVTPCLVYDIDNPTGLPEEPLRQFTEAITRDRPSFVRDLAGPFFGSHIGLEVPQPLIDWGIRMVLEASPLASVEMMRTFFFNDFRDDVAAIRLPTLIVHGDSDMGAPIEATGQPTHELISGSQLKVYERGPHGLPLTHRDQLTVDILAFAEG